MTSRVQESEKRLTFLLVPLSPVGSTHTGAALSSSVNKLSALTNPAPSSTGVELNAQSAVFFSVLSLFRFSSLTPPFDGAGGGGARKKVDGELGEGWRLTEAREERR